jgi:micrococcal nuclease
MSEKKSEAAWRYDAQLIRVVDGDTVDAMVDLGFSTHRKLRIRFDGIDAPESRTRDDEEKVRGKAATARLVEILDAEDGAFVVESHGVGKFGRCLGVLYTKSLGEVSVNQTLIDEGHGVEYSGGKR